MGQKVRPTGIRIGITRDWSSRWYATKQEFGKFLKEDHLIRKHIKSEFYSAGVPLIEIERDGDGESRKVTINLHAARPGVVIGRKGARVDELRTELEAITGGKVQLNIAEVNDPDTNAQLVAENVADQLLKRQPFRRVLKNTIRNTRERGALGVKVMVAGRLGGAEMARREYATEGKIPLSTLRADIDYGFAEARTTYGVIGVKTWIYKGEILDKNKKGGQRHGANAQTR
ncbi:MAG: 30S ribosomal protein S3 [Planctomycetota bacterium]